MNLSPIFLRLFKIRLVLGLHSSLPWLHFSKMPGNFIRNYFTKIIMQFSIYSCDHLIVTSKTSKIVEVLSLNPDKVSFIYLGIDKKFLEKTEKNKKIINNFKYNNYILSVLSCVKYHNIINLLKAFKLSSEEMDSNIKFVLVMQILDKDYYKEIINYINDNFTKGKIIIFSNLDNSYLINLYKYAKFYIFSSYCEVFGLTSLEAMSQNCPVVLSNRSALPEINSDAAYYFDPDNEIQIKESINKILNDDFYRNSLINRGEKHYKNFSWEKTVLETSKILRI